MNHYIHYISIPISDVDLNVDIVLDREKQLPESIEFDALQTHFDQYLHTLRLALGKPGQTEPANNKDSSLLSTRRQPSRNTAAAAMAAKVASRKVSESRFFSKTDDRIKPKKPKFLPIPKSEDPVEYRARNSWRTNNGANGLESDSSDLDPSVEVISRQFGTLDFNLESPAPLESSWEYPLLPSTTIASLTPLRIPLQAKYSKRCMACNHTLIRPESKAQSLRWKIKTLALTYLPAVEVGNRKIVVESDLRSSQTSQSGGSHSGAQEENEQRQALIEPLRREQTVGPHSFEQCIQTFVDPLNYLFSMFINSLSRILFLNQHPSICPPVISSPYLNYK